MIIDANRTFCFTGHRPNKLYGYDKNSEGNKVIRQAIKDAIIYAYLNNNIKNFISGMALGIDQWAAEEVLKLQNKYSEIKLIVAIPCKDHSASWPKESQKNWMNIVSKSNLAYYVSNLPYNGMSMQRRNEWMVNNSCGQIAVWDGTKGGTCNCLNYANKKDKTKRIVINPQTFTVKLYGL